MTMSVNGCCPYQGELLPRALPPLIIIEFLLGVQANGFALWVFCWHMRPWKSSTVLLFNLALADFFLNMVLPFRASYYLSKMDWKFGDVFCRIFLFLVALNRGSGIAFLTLITLDRYVRVLHPHHRLNSASATGATVAVWVLTVSLNAHFLKVPQQLAVGNAMQCESFLVCLTVAPASLLSRTASFVIIFLVPLALILVCSLRIISELRRRHLDHHGDMKRTISSLAMVMVVFVVCFLPSKVFQVLIWVKVWSQKSCKSVMNGVFYATLTLTYLNSILDPVLFYFSSPAFQRVCRQLVRLQSTEGTVDTGGWDLRQQLPG